ncbi:MAG: KDGP aldolase [Angelakisella sp.]
MIYNRLDFYNDKVLINLLAKDLDNAVEVMEVLEGHGLVGVISKNFDTVDAAVETVKAYMKKIKNVSVGLGAGDPKQWKMVAEIAARTDPGHANQVFTGAMYTQGALKEAGCTNTVVNCLMSPTGVVGRVKISTGEYSSLAPDAIVEVDTAIAMMKDLGLPSIKFFNIGGLKHLDELEAVARAAVKGGIPIMEPTGGIDVENVYDIVKVCHNAGCERIIPHIYTSIIDKASGKTVPDMVQQAYDQVKRIF